ncbi:MAG: group III truncated hemoglobin [Cyclobacteriaceae bacterium]|nr:group III truncated hemoglobin [Cyclobacteriaceae bacterium]
MSDITRREDIVFLVDTFYDKVIADDLLSPVFAHVDWPAHMPTMYSFWASLLLAEQSYRGNPYQKHVSLPITARHFRRWLKLFSQTVNQHFEGPKASEAIERAKAIASLFQHRMGLNA